MPEGTSSICPLYAKGEKRSQEETGIVPLVVFQVIGDLVGAANMPSQRVYDWGSNGLEVADVWTQARQK